MSAIGSLAVGLLFSEISPKHNRTPLNVPSMFPDTLGIGRPADKRVFPRASTPN